MIDISFLRIVAVALLSLDDTFGVALQASARMNCHSKGLFLQKFLDSLVWCFVFLLLSGNEESLLVSVSHSAWPFSSLVLNGVFFVQENTILSNPCIGVKHPTSLATEVVGVTVDQLLDWELRGSIQVILNCIETLEGSCGGPSPARTAWSLVAWDWDLAAPVDWLWEVRVFKCLLCSHELMLLLHACQWHG